MGRLLVDRIVKLHSFTLHKSESSAAVLVGAKQIEKAGHRHDIRDFFAETRQRHRAALFARRPIKREQETKGRTRQILNPAQIKQNALSINDLREDLILNGGNSRAV